MLVGCLPYTCTCMCQLHVDLYRGKGNNESAGCLKYPVQSHGSHMKIRLFSWDMANNVNKEKGKESSSQVRIVNPAGVRVPWMRSLHYVAVYVVWFTLLAQGACGACTPCNSRCSCVETKSGQCIVDCKGTSLSAVPQLWLLPSPEKIEEMQVFMQV